MYKIDWSCSHLAKIVFWLIEKQFRVLIAACGTFRSSAVEQLRTHMHKLSYFHPPEQNGGQTMVELYEEGYGRDAASIARSAINHGVCCVLLHIFPYRFCSYRLYTVNVWSVIS
ncbi:hypothetical protein PHET_09187 [Paragonimus heterotremus]|uniref:SRP54-type proteins GTP-binding domain-containing protein n=1 Tax=Paragonimus heterotremus TaxID=100268 RepID=A0A8J4SLE9_9TREM|nr:hypothetical protein PHET_09187 [Paragonimus heterotremus]